MVEHGTRETEKRQNLMRAIKYGTLWRHMISYVDTTHRKRRKLQVQVE